MRPLTDNQHKTLLEVAGQPLIDRIIDDLVALGVHTHLVVTGYRADDLKNHLQSRYPQEQWIFVHNARYRDTNNIMSLAMAFEHLPDGHDIILIESDLVCSPGLLRRVVESPWPNVALIDRYRTGMDGTVVTVADGVVTSVIPPHLQGANFDFSDKYKTLNIYKFSAEFCRNTFRGLLQWYANTMDNNIYYELIIGILIYLRQARIYVELVNDAPWSEIDDPCDFRVAAFTFEPENRQVLLEETMGGYWSLEILDFHFLRNMHWPTPAMYGELRRNLPALMQNYCSSQIILDIKLTWWLSCQKGRATLLPGLSQIFPFLQRWLHGQCILIPRPTFGEYSRVFPEAISYHDDFAVDLGTVEAEAIRLNARAIVIVSPNNPTGTTLEGEDIVSLASRHPQRLFVVDESFKGFSSATSVVELLEREPLDNVIVLVSLSKTMGVPGVRLGYLYTSNSALTARLHQELPIWNLGSIAEHLLEIALKNRVTWLQSLQQTRRDRSVFAAALRSLSQISEVIEGGANFVVVKLDERYQPPQGLVAHLLAEHKIYILSMHSKNCRRQVLVSIGRARARREPPACPDYRRPAGRSVLGSKARVCHSNQRYGKNRCRNVTGRQSGPARSSVRPTGRFWHG